MATAPATTRLPNIKGWVYDDEDSYCRVEDEEAREMVTDAYDPTATYTQGATCIQDNKLYRAKADITTAEVWTPDHWEGTSLEQIRKDMETEISTLNANTFKTYEPNLPIIDLSGSIREKIFTLDRGIYLFYTQSSIDSASPGDVSFTLVNKAGDNYIYLYQFIYDNIYYVYVNQSSTSLKWTKITQ